MKIVQSVQKLYADNFPFFKVLKKEVDKIILHQKNNQWHYVSRLKEQESFALKFETGRFGTEEIFEDFFASTIVVQNLSEINLAHTLISKFFKVHFQKPKFAAFTHKASDSFSFDDLRVYVSLIDPGTGKLAPKIYSLVFEIQIKTFLQHAWAIATHDLIYKSDKIYWSRERVAYQVKAALEHAEVSISGVEELSKVSEIAKENKEVKKINQMISLLGRLWVEVDLPKDRRRLAQNIIALLDAVGISSSELNTIIRSETTAGRGSNIRNLSPYLIVVQALYTHREVELMKYLRSKSGHQKILITSELNFPSLTRVVRNKIIII